MSLLGVRPRIDVWRCIIAPQLPSTAMRKSVEIVRFYIVVARDAPCGL
jgi:hypothetical protein